MPRIKTDPIERFWNLVNKTESCWLWIGKNDAGYGRFKNNSKSLLAHRYAYEITKGPIPKGLQIDHLCRVRQCVNPDHLEAVTSKVNMLRGNTVASRNANKTHCAQGHPFEGENLFINVRGARCCKKCAREATKRFLKK